MPDTLSSNEAVATREPPIIVSDAELERLLDEATSLSQELADEVGKSLGETSWKEAGDEEGVAAQAIDAVEEPDATEAPPPATEQAKPLPDLLQDPDATAAKASAEPVQEPAAIADAATPEIDDPPSAPRRSERIETRDEEIAEKARAEAAENESSEIEEAQEEEHRSGPSVKERLTASCKLAVRLVRAVPIGIANACLMIFVILDRPFRGMSPGLKRMLGLIGLATLLAGIATWILPEMMDNNPFADMDRYTKSRG